MITKKIIYTLITLLILSSINCGKKENSLVYKENETKEVKENTKKNEMTFKDYLGTGKSITFGNVDYKLAWSSNPSDNLYMQEYVSADDSIENFKRLILLQAVTGNAKMKDVVDAKVSELKKMKEKDPMVNYAVFEKDGELMLDFLISGKLPDSNQQELIERNVYRYRTFKDKSGVDGVMLFGISDRAYGNDITNFLTDLKNHRYDVPNAASSFIIPDINITK